jgi:hypothetical protein
METTSSSSSPTTTRFDAPSPEAIARAEAAAAAIPDIELDTIRVDVTAAAAGVIGQVEAIEAHRAAIVAVFGEEGTVTLDGLVPAAHHLIIANGRFNASGDRDLEPLATSLREKRNYLQMIASAIQERGIPTAQPLGKLKGGTSYVAVADDTLALYSWLSSNRGAVSEHCKLTPAELDAIQSEALRFMGAVGIKQRAGVGAAALARQRAFTHFARTYGRARKFVTYVRWHEDDYDQIAPSIYAGRTRSAATPATPVVPTTNTNVAPGMPGAPALGPIT